MTERLKSPDFRDKYRWPDPDQGWSGPLAGYPPDHPIRRGIPIPLRLIARQFRADPAVIRYQKTGHITLPLSQELGADVTETPARVTETPAITVTDVTDIPPPVTEIQEAVTDIPKGRGRPKSGGMSAAEKQAAYRKRKEERAGE